MLILNNISKKYRGSNKYVLKNINLEFKEKELVSILGPSGCGKSTLLNLIGGLDKPTSGNIMVDNKDLSTLKNKELDYYHNKYIGFVFQNYNLINHLTVKDNIELVTKSKNIDKLLRQVGLLNFQNTKVSKLSGGQMQRVAIARALVNNPKIILCDEPTGALDSENSIKIMELLKSISKERLVIIVTHNEELANLYSDRIIRLKDGKQDRLEEINIIKDISKFKYKKVKIKLSKILNIVINNLLNKLKRNILTILAFSVGLISLSIVLGISTGFNKQLEYEEKNSLSKYPIYISKDSINIDQELNNIFTTEEQNIKDKIYSYTSSHENKITKEYVDNLKVLNNNLDYKIMTYVIDNKIITTINKELKGISLLAGVKPQKENEVYLLIDYKNKIDSYYLKSIGLNNKIYNYDDIIGYKYKIQKKEYTITAVYKIREDSTLSDLSGIIYNKFINNKIPASIYLYPKSYNDKIKILNHLNKYPNIYFTDYSTSIKSVSKTLMDALSIVLICFSMISLLVSTIMIGIISYISIIERIKEIGILKSLGTSNYNIKLIFYLENVVIALLSSLLSYIITYVASIPINNLLLKLTGIENILILSPKIIIIICALSVVLSVIGSYLPIKKTKKLYIIDSLKYE